MNNCETPLSGLSTPPSHEKYGERARRRLFLSPDTKTSLKPYVVTKLSFDDTNESDAVGFATSTPVASTPIKTEELNALLPPLEGPMAEEVIVESSPESSPGWRDRLLADLCRPMSPTPLMLANSPTSLANHPKPDPSPLPRKVRHLLRLRGNLTQPVTVVVTKYTTYEIIPQ